jgi:hypothetical protein
MSRVLAAAEEDAKSAATVALAVTPLATRLPAMEGPLWA